MNVPDAIVPTEVDVDVNLTHTYIGDLIVELRNPFGTTVRLHNLSGGSADNIITTFDDLTPPDGPGSMAAFTGVSAAGNWTLFISDNAGQDVGTLNSWTLRFRSPAPCDPVVAVTPTPPAARFQLAAPQPNPFTSSTSIAFTLPTEAPVSLAVYNLLGQRVAQLLDGPRPAGSHQVQWSGRDDSGAPVTSGIYFVRLVAPGHRATQRMSLVR
jgi:subtilisin-like proprotein convertase family protein